MTNATISRLNRLQIKYARQYAKQCERLSRSLLEGIPRIIMRAEQERTYLNLSRVRYYLRMAQLD